jgi:ribosomal protein S2
LFVSNVYNSHPPVKEALNLGIPCLGVVDTNVLADVISIPFPGNDESIDCIIFYNSLISHYILLEKFVLIIAWYYQIKKKNRLGNFST